MLDIAVAYNRYRFLGDEFLTWVFFIIDNHPDILNEIDADLSELQIGNRLLLENRIGNHKEMISIKGDDAGLEEGFLALSKGALVVELALIYKANHQEWTFTIKGENMAFSNLKLPQTGPVENKEDWEGLVLEKVYLIEKAVQLIDGLFKRFLTLRIDEAWQHQTIPHMKNWVQRSLKLFPESNG
jgi:hypothetical protein